MDDIDIPTPGVVVAVSLNMDINKLQGNKLLVDDFADLVAVTADHLPHLLHGRPGDPVVLGAVRVGEEEGVDAVSAIGEFGHEQGPLRGHDEGE
ncbi:hypothetical protein ABT282_08300 [Streptomyces sp. NPDC000927]|uniref:hypothetical protein n=1 Tax=Streptomyces sp. NPDC000927 TaxID=3154371 RepID=UPI00332B4A42